MAFLGQDTVECKIVVDNKPLQKVKNFNYFGFEISYENEKNNQQNFENFSKILGILYISLKPTLVEKFSRIKVYNALAILNLLYGSEIWTLGVKNKYD